MARITAQERKVLSKFARRAALARMTALSPERRREIAIIANHARTAKRKQAAAAGPAPPGEAA